MQKCTKCGLEKENEAFYWKAMAKNKRASVCISCMKEYQKSWYSRNTEIQKSKSTSRRKDIRDFLDGIKQGSVCKLCGESEPCCLQFHHIDGDKKEISLSMVASHGWATERIHREVEKCTVLCANCHFKVHNGIRSL